MLWPKIDQKLGQEMVEEHLLDHVVQRLRHRVISADHLRRRLLKLAFHRSLQPEQLTGNT